MRLLWLLPILASLSDEAAQPEILRVTEPARDWTDCIADLGCIKTHEGWYHPVYRPHNPLPSKRFTIKTNFVLFRKGGKSDGEAITTQTASIEAAGFSRGLGTAVLVHDFTSNGHTGWVRRLAEALLAQAERNVVAVDWENGALPPYVQAAANARVVALEVKALLDVFARNFSVEPSAVHVVGHGLGAHIAGYVGASVNGLSRITGLDPSGPLFENMPPFVRLDSSDAAFVDVVHTDASSWPEPQRADGQGLDEPCGHVDFYPNGGRDQPGCSPDGERNVLKVTRDAVPGGSILHACSHKRAFKYFIESVAAARTCQFLSFLCDDYAAFQDGRCASCGHRGGKCSVMGLAAPKYPPSSPGRYFVQTTNATPFCNFMYRVDLHLAKPARAKARVSGWMMLSLVGKAGPPISMPLESKVTLLHGSTQQMLAFHGAPYVSPVAKAQLSWRYRVDLWHPGTVCVLCDDSLYVNRLVVTSLPLEPSANETTVALCSCDAAPVAKIRSDFSHVFVPCLQEPVTRWHRTTKARPR